MYNAADISATERLDTNGTFCIYKLLEEQARCKQVKKNQLLSVHTYVFVDT